MSFKSVFSRISIFTSIVCSVFFISASEDPAKASALRTSLITLLQLEHATKSQHEGFASGVIVQTNNGPRKIEGIEVGDQVLSKHLKNGTLQLCLVLNVTKERIPNYRKIILENQTIITAPGQKFYLPRFNIWVTAFALSKLPSLRNAFPEPILAIDSCDECIEVYKLTVAQEHNFYITESHLLVHNFVPFVGLAIPPVTHFIITLAGPVAGTVILQTGQAVAPAIGGWIAACIIKGVMNKPHEGKPGHHDSDEKYDTNNKEHIHKYKHKNHEYKKKIKEVRSKFERDGTKHQIGISECNHLDINPNYMGCGNKTEAKDQTVSNLQGQCNLADTKLEHMGCGTNVASTEQYILGQQKCNASIENQQYKVCGNAEYKNQDDLFDQNGCNYSKVGPELFPAEDIVQTNDNDKKKDKSQEEEGEHVSELSGKSDHKSTQESEINMLNDPQSGKPTKTDEKGVQAEIAQENDQELVSLAKLRQAIVNREKKVVDSDLKKLGFSGDRVITLTEANPRTGRIGVNTEFDGSFEDACKVYEEKVKDFSNNRLFIGEETKIVRDGEKRICSKFNDGSIVQLRTLGNSGHPKIDIKDEIKNVEEKITFK